MLLENKRMNEINIISKDAIEAETKAHTDIQIETAKKYPREIEQVLRKIQSLACASREIAESCFYALPRDNKIIQGASIRLAEIVANSWGNIRSQARIIGIDDKTVTAQGIAWDLENNVAYAVEVKRKITNKFGKRFSEDMIIVTSNACSSIALRNAIFKIVPMAILSNVINRIKEVSMGKEEDLIKTRDKALKFFLDKGVKEKQVLDILGLKKKEEIMREDIFVLRGLVNAIQDGDTTLEQAFASDKTRTGLDNLADTFLNADLNAETLISEKSLEPEPESETESGSELQTESETISKTESKKRGRKPKSVNSEN